jgi:hypothetical protein
LALFGAHGSSLVARGSSRDDLQSGLIAPACWFWTLFLDLLLGVVGLDELMSYVAVGEASQRMNGGAQRPLLKAVPQSHAEHVLPAGVP